MFGQVKYIERERADEMKATIGCFDRLVSADRTFRFSEIVDSYKLNYAVFDIDIEIPSDKKIKTIRCENCGQEIRLDIRGKKRALARQCLIFFSFLLSLPISLLLFNVARHDTTNGFWTLAVLFFIFGCILTSTLAFDVKKFEFENFVSIKHKGDYIQLEGKAKALRHKLIENNYKPRFAPIYSIFKIAFFLSIAIYAIFFFEIVIRGNSEFVFIASSIFALFALGLPMLFLIDKFYDKHFAESKKIE
jgi:hypothetical protein